VALPTGWVVGYDVVNNTYTFYPPVIDTTPTTTSSTSQPSSNVSIAITTTTTPDDHYVVTFASYIAIQCGFPFSGSPTSYVASSANPLTSAQPASMTIEKLLMVSTSFLLVPGSNMDNITSTDNSIQDSIALLKIPVDVAPYDELVWCSNDVDLQRKRLSNQHISQVDLSITDEYNRPLQMTQDWVLTVVVEYWAPIASFGRLAADVDLMRRALHYMALSVREHSGKSPTTSSSTSRKKLLPLRR